ncbi:MAG: hypothetical protein J5643_10075 [Lachnospiraceae bacterium]|nr:hypothetical protein [Lachnospiraceae bacterium]
MSFHVEEEAVKRLIRVIFAAAILLGCLRPFAGNVKAEDDNICTIKVWNDGYATTADGTRVTEVPYGTPVTIRWEIPKDKWIRSYFISQKGEGIEYGIEYFSEKIKYEGLTPEGLERYSLTVELDIASRGPGKYDYSVNATIEEQVPVTIDLTKGIVDLSECKELEDYQGPKDFLAGMRDSCKPIGTDTYVYGDCAYDLDGNGTADLLVRVLTPNYAFYSADMEIYGTPYLVPSGECSIGGAYTVTLDKNSYYAKYSPITFLFSEEPVKKEYSVSVENGRAKLAGGKEVSKAAPGETVYLTADALSGKYVDSWKCDAFDSALNRIRQNDYDQTYVPFIMPCRDVNWESVVKDQTPVTIDLSKGFWIAPTPEDAGMYWIESVYYPRNYRLVKNTDLSKDGYLYGKADLDGDGTADIIAGYFGSIEGPSGWNCNSYFVIPLSGNSIKGEYTIAEPNDGPHGPYKIIFPTEPVGKKYRVTVTGGQALDEKGNRITEAAPGTIVIVNLLGHGPTEFEPDPEYYYLQNSSASWGSPAAFLMPACDISYIAEDEEGGGGRDREVTVAFSVSNDEARWEYQVPVEDRDAIYSAWDALEEKYRDFGIDWNSNVISMRLNTLDEYMAGRAYAVLYPYPATVRNVTVNFESFPISVKGGTAHDGRNYSEDIVYGIPGHLITIEVNRSANDETHYAVPESENIYLEYHKEDLYEGYMPNHSVNVSIVLKEGTPIVMDLNEGPFTYTDRMALCIYESLQKNTVSGKMDLDGDGNFDILINQEKKTIEALPEYSCGEEFRSSYNNPGPYYPIIIRYGSNKGNSDITPAPTGDDKPTEAPDGNGGSDSPENGQSAADERKEGKLNPLWIILPAAAVLLAAAGAFLFLRRRKSPEDSVKDGEEQETQAER